MQLFSKNFAVLTLAGAVTLAAGGCEKSRDEMRPDMDKIVSGEHGPQSRDLREMASRLAPQLVQIPDIVHNQFRVSIVMKDMTNKTEDMPGRDMNIFLVKLKGLLNNESTRDRLFFVEQRQVTESLQASEGAGPTIGQDEGRFPTTPTRIIPQYALYGTVYSMNNGRTSYYIFEFKLTNITTGAEVWNGQYDVRTLN